MIDSLVSVVIPCFNQAHFVPDAIESVLAQSHVPIEIIVVDDGSSDDTSSVVSRYTQVHLLRQPNQGLAAARNSGFAASRGEYLVFLDADDHLVPDGVAVGLNSLGQHPECAFTWGRYTLRNERNETWRPEEPSVDDIDAYAALLRGNHIAMHATVLYRRIPLELVGGFDAQLSACEDYELYLRMTRRFPIIKHDNMVAEYRRHGGNMSVDSLRMLQAALQVLAAQRDYVDANPVYRNAYASGLRFWQRFYGIRSIAKIARELMSLRVSEAIADTGSLFRSVGTSTVLLNAPLWLIRHWISERSLDGKS